MPLDLTQLRSFLEVAERGSVAAAAAHLGYTPPAVSQHVAKLERALDAVLFDRVGGQLTLADAGASLIPLARDLIALAEQATDVVRVRPARSRVVIAGLASAVGALVAPQLAGLHDLATIHIVEAEDDDALRELRLGHADIALVQRYPGDPMGRDPRLLYTDLDQDRLRLVLPPSYPSDASLHDLGELPWLVNGTGTRCEAATRRVLHASGIEPDVVADVVDNYLLLSLVAAGHGATIMPDLVVQAAGVDVTVSTRDLGVARTIVAVTRRTGSAAARDVLERLAAEAGRTHVLESPGA